MTRGFFLGKFLPPHNGHLFVCGEALAQVDQLTVLVCSHDAEPIDGHLRAGWMRQCLPQKAAHVVHMHRDIPQEPNEHPDFWRIWQQAIAEHHPEPIDVVFGSETYVHKLAQVLNAAPVVVDLERRSVPVSGTKIREAPHRHWGHIPLPVRPYFQKRVTLVGPESTGKSTLAQRLADHFKTKVIPEYGREYDAQFKQGAGWGDDDFLKITDGHRASAAAIAPQAGPIVVEDTNLLQTVVWSQALLQDVSPALAARLGDIDPPELYLLLSPNMDWVDDGTRYHASLDARQLFHARLKHWLDATRATWVEIAGSNWPDRTDQAIQAINDAFGDMTL